MANLKSVSLVERTARSVVEAYLQVAESTDKALGGGDPNRRPTLSNVGNLKGAITSVRTRAEAVIADPDFTTLDPDLRDDLTAIAEEWSKLETEIDSHIDPDTEWGSMAPGDKHDLVARRFANADHIAVMRDRLHLKLREQNAPPVLRKKQGGQP